MKSYASSKLVFKSGWLPVVTSRRIPNKLQLLLTTGTVYYRSLSGFRWFPPVHIWQPFFCQATGFFFWRSRARLLAGNVVPTSEAVGKMHRRLAQLEIDSENGHPMSRASPQSWARARSGRQHEPSRLCGIKIPRGRDARAWRKLGTAADRMHSPARAT